MTKTVFYRFGILFTLLFSTIDLSAAKQPPSKDWRQSVLDDIDFIHHTYETSYGPVNWKHDYQGCDFNSEVLKAKLEVMLLEKQSAKAIRSILKRLMFTLKDYHVVMTFFSTEKAFLPFDVRESEGRYFIVHLDGDNPMLPFSVGDELLTFDGKPIDDVVTDLQMETTENHPLTDRALATIKLTFRAGIWGDIVSTGGVKLTWRKAGTQKVDAAKIPWQYYPEMVNGLGRGIPEEEKSLPGLVSDLPKKKPIVEEWHPYVKLVNHGVVKEAYFPERESGVGLHDIDARESFVPYLGKVLWETKKSDFFHAYTFKLPSGKVAGYVRIPTYHVDNAVKRVASFSKLMEKMQKETSILVIDQNNNGGGYDMYLFGLLRTLADKPLELPRERIMLTYEDVARAVSAILEPYVKSYMGSTILGYPVDDVYVDNFIKFQYAIKNEWSQGRRLTNPLPLDGIEQIPANPKAYKKPILVLINELDISCGDFFPAIMQDNDRATLLGTRTSGAGGAPVKTEFMNLSGISAFYLTGSIAERESEEHPIENLGVTPDIEYQLTPADYEFGYQGYKKKVVSTLETMLKTK